MTMKELQERVKMSENEERITEIRKRIQETEVLIEQGNQIMESFLEQLRDLEVRIPKEIRYMRNDREDIAQYEMNIAQKYEEQKLLNNAMVTLKDEYSKELKALEASLRDCKAAKPANRQNKQGYVAGQKTQDARPGKKFWEMTQEELFEHNRRSVSYYMELLKDS